jgi:O-antigen/teichoic acid export membrane protein
MAILFGLTELLIPELARCNAGGSKERIDYLVKQSLRIALLFGTACSCVLFLSAEALCMRLYGSTDAGTYLRWFAPLAVMLYCDTVTDAMIKGLGQQKICVRYNILTSALDVTFLYYLLPRYGMEGYYLSFLVTHAVNFLLSLRRLLNITIRHIPAYASVLSAAAMVFGIYAASHLGDPGLRSCSFVLILGSLLFLCKALRLEDFRWAAGLICKK